MKKLMSTILVLLFLLTPLNVIKALDCETKKEDHWVCKGDKAWTDGYLIPSATLQDIKDRLTLLEEREAKYKLLSEESLKLNVALTEKNQELLSSLEESEGVRKLNLGKIEQLDNSLSSLEKDYQLLRLANEEYKEQLNSVYAPWETWTLVGGISVATLALGLGVGALFWK